MKDASKYLRLRQEMVRKQIKARGINDLKVLSAMSKVPRHLFVSEALMDQAYSDYPLPIGDQQTISQPLIVAEMTQALKIGAEDRVLEIGTGSGYQAAILSEIAFRVYTVERNHRLFLSARKLFDQFEYYNIVAKYADGTTGWRDEGPFDAILITAGAPKIPETLVAQLADGGRMVIPVGNQSTQELIKIERSRKTIHTTRLGRCRFVKLIGQHGWKESS